MTLWQKIIAIYPELTDADFHPIDGTINLKDDSDGLGAYIAKWNHAQPLPVGMKIGK